uniref:Testis expressed 26 n=1 Tax=Leptobrachium leishanense TaxID=445787 RepID=A0A8C5QBX5_9ANUR
MFTIDSDEAVLHTGEKRANHCILTGWRCTEATVQGAAHVPERKEQVHCGETEVRPSSRLLAAVQCTPRYQAFRTQGQDSNKAQNRNGYIRPKTSNGYRNPYQLCDPVGMSIYTDEFCCKPYSKPDLIRAATASGARSHNPNPNKDPTFITWRPPREKVPLDTDSLGMKPPSAEDVQRTIRAQYCSTYKGDYLGLPQGYQIKYAINPPPNWKREIPRPLDTESRFNYQIQPRAPELRDFTRKYGCYSHLHVPSKGAVPTVISSHIRNQENKKQLTTYQRHFGKEYVNFSLLVNSLDPEELKMYLRNVPVEDRRGLVRFVNAVSESKCHPIESK